MNILNITAQKPDSTGSGVYGAELVRCQRASGHNVAMICGIAPEDTPHVEKGTTLFPVVFESEQLPFHVCGMSDEMPYAATRYRDLTPHMTDQFCHAFAQMMQTAMRDFKPDLVLCHHLYLVTAVAREQMPHLPMGAICHSTDLRQMEKHMLERDRIIAAMRKLDVIFALHEQQKREIVALYGVDPDRVCVVGTGFNSQVFCRAGRTNADTYIEAHTDTNGDTHTETHVDAQRISPTHCDDLSLVYAGKIWGKKGVPQLIAALEQVEAPNRRVVLRLAGGYNDPQEYKRIVDQAKASSCSIEFLGKLAQPELARAYRQAELFVLPSFFEGLPLVVIEALACGCKVVMTDLPGIRPWIERNVQDAPIIYVAPPRMRRVDEPYAEDLPAFESRLARAIEQACALEAGTCDVSGLSWECLSSRVLAAFAPRSN